MNIFNKLKNSISQYPKVFFARHIGEGVVSYKNTDGGEDIFFIGNDTLKKMNASFTGKPVYIQHQDVPLSQMKERAAGYVVESFYLPEDGKQWLKMLITDDEAFDAIQNGWKVSNAYNVKDLGAGGVWHNIPYKREILDGEYEHLALVADPRYEEAVIMTPEDFKSYKEAKKKELDAMSLDNSKKAVLKKAEAVENNKERKTMFQFFTKKKVENMDGVALQDVEVQLENGSSMKIGDIVKSVEENLKKQATETPIEEKKVMVNGKEVTISALIKMYNEQEKGEKAETEKAETEKANEGEEGKDGKDGKEADKTDKANETDEADKTDKRKLIEEVGGFLKEKGLSDEDIRFVIGKMEKGAYEKDEDGKEANGKKANETDPDKKDEKANCDPAKKTNEDDKDDKDKKDEEDADKKTNSKESSDFDRLLNAVGSFKAKESVVETLETRLERGQDLYGSEK